jgi:hypothetical protein
VHQGCSPQSAGLAYEVKDTTVTSNTAVVTVSLAGAAASIGSESEAFTYSAGRWGLVPDDLSFYRHGRIRADIAAAKAAGTAPVADPWLRRCPPVQDLAGHRTLVRAGTA